uniref:EF-hand domain-containing protein n=2 Tax=Meloidogyne floridensis TaxID=298350 RepID=A0A915NK46_9BILA
MSHQTTHSSSNRATVSRRRARETRADVEAIPLTPEELQQRFRITVDLLVDEKLMKLSDTFDLLDLDKDGRLSRNEIAALLRSSAKIEPTRKELDFLFSEMDHEITYLRCPLINRITVKELRNQFKEIAWNGDGSITKEDLSHILAKTADLKDENAVEVLFETIDQDQDGRISFEEFIRMMRE